ncbi:dihydrofolate reductase [Nonomuraea muscovyensis]|uniref:Dihydrofolate reductase n=1 Tax=Nonomuraea muscovyensis TaxID=1124761 RepID=A0A7X0C9Z5_9ACTN|nr:dihydrofolate reductase family protein [Nonomuraea muscovyensis]MBB6350250.1 dihydrofolate reductase [Nonomuraea muscovyensis]
MVVGSGTLVRSLLARDRVDELVLLIHPLVLGSGRRLWTGGGPAALRPADSVTTGTGVIIAAYGPATG